MTIENIIIVDEKPSKGGRERDFFLSGHPSKKYWSQHMQLDIAIKYDPSNLRTQSILHRKDYCQTLLFLLPCNSQTVIGH